jgi:hypothetical protein
MRERIVISQLLLILIVSAPAALRAQAVGAITGTVTDPTGAVVPGVKVTATRVETGVSQSTVTTSAGTYTIPSLVVGAYNVTAEAGGFKTRIASGITLDVSQERSVDFKLALAGVTSAVEVNAAPPLLDTTSGSLGGLVSGQQVVTLPLNGRDITNLLLLQPGVNIEVDSTLPLTSNPSGNLFVASNGNRGPTMRGYLDGLDASDNDNGGELMSNLNLDAIAEFKILQNNFSAEYGQGGGAKVLLVTKSGTSQLHGTAFEYLRNSVLDARNFFSTVVPPFRRNEFGGTFGGPMVVPHVYNGKDRTFFFLEYAGFRQRLGEPVLIPVPTAQERQGIVSITGANGQPDQLLVPLNPVAKTVLDSYPFPNQPNGPLGARTFNFEYSVPQNTDQWSARFDHNFSPKDALFVRFTYANNELPVAEPSSAVLSKNFSGEILNDQRVDGLTETHTFTPTLLNTFRFAYTVLYEPELAREKGITQTDFEDGSLATWGPESQEFSSHPERFIFSDSVVSVKGRHMINVGGEFRRGRADEFGSSGSGLNGIYYFQPGTPLPVAIPSASGNNNLDAGAPSPNSLLSFMTGAPASYQRALQYPGFGPVGGGFGTFGVRRFNLNGWIQDDIKWVRLTLNIGLRYEYNSVPYEVADRLGGIVDDSNFEGGSLFRKFVLNPSPVYFPDYRGFGPRFGFAYRLRSKTVLRGGFGVFTNMPLDLEAEQQAVNFPFVGTGVVSQPTYSLPPLSVAGLPVLTDLQGNAMPPGGNTHNIPPNDPVNLAPVAAIFGNVLDNTTSMGLRNGYTTAGNVTLERELPGDFLLQMGYVTNNGVKLEASEWPNAYAGAEPQYSPFSIATPGLGEFQLIDNHGHSIYHSLQSMVRKVSPSHGLQLQASYTWSKVIDNASTIFNGPTQDSDILQNNPTCWKCERSASAFDIPQRLVLNLIYTPPTDRWQTISFMPKRLIQGWQITSIAEVQSGFPFTVTSPYGTEPYGTDVYVGIQATRPDLIQQPTLKSGGSPEEQFFSNAVIANNGMNGQFFGVPTTTSPNGTTVQTVPGNLGRNTFRTHSFSNVDASLIKDTKITERIALQFRGEFFNLFNLHAFGIPGQVLGMPGFGTSSSTVLPERQIQFALKLIF